mgnify:CR=1 FL=1
MNFKFLLLLFFISSSLISVSYGCHDTGDSNCKPKETYNKSVTHGSDHTKVYGVVNNENDDNEEALNNNPYDKYSKKKNKRNTSTEINENNAKEKIIRLLRSENDQINKQKTSYLDRKNYIDKLSFLNNSIKTIFKDDNTIPVYEKSKIFKDLDKSMEQYLNKIEKKMIIKYDFGYFLNDLSLTINNTFKEISKAISQNSLNLNNNVQINDAQLVEQKIDELDYISKLYSLLKKPENKNNKDLGTNKLASLISGLKNQKYRKENKVKFLLEDKKNKSNIKNKFSINKENNEISNLENKIENLEYVSKVFDIIGKQ